MHVEVGTSHTLTTVTYWTGRLSRPRRSGTTLSEWLPSGISRGLYSRVRIFEFLSVKRDDRGSDRGLNRAPFLFLSVVGLTYS